MPLTRLCLAHPRAALAGVACITLIALGGLTRVRTEIGYRSFLGSRHPTVQRFDGFLARYGGGLPLAAVWDCAQTERCSSVFDPWALRMAASVARSVSVVPGVRAVESPATSPVLVGSVFGAELRRLVEFGEVVGDRESLARAALADPLWQGTLVSRDGSVGAIVVEVASSAGDTSRRVFAALREALRPFEDRGVDFAFVGGPVEFVVAGAQLPADSRRLIPLMVLLIGGCVGLVLGSWLVTAASLATVGLAVIWSLGLLGWLGWPQTSVSEVLAPLVLAVGACDVIHLLSHRAALAHAAPAGLHDAGKIIASAAEEVWRPCMMTSLTTALGLASFASSDLEAFARFGWVASFAVMAAFVLTFTLLPLLLQALPAARSPGGNPDLRGAGAIGAVVDFVRRRARAVLIVTTLLALTCTVGLFRLSVESDFTTLYGADSPVVRWAEFVGHRLRLPDSLEIDVVAPEGQTVLSPGGLEVVASIGEGLSRIDGLGTARSVATVLTHAAHVLGRPRAASTASEYRRLAPRSFARWVASDGAAARISVEAEKSAQHRLRASLAGAAEVLGRLPAGWTYTMTGPVAVVRDMLDDIRATQMRSFALAFALIFAVLLWFFRSPPLALAAMVPTALPAWMVLGVMGLSGVALDVGGAMVAAVVMGVAVDDTIHLLTQRARWIEAGTPSEHALSRALADVGPALVTTSLALALGFLSLLVSSWHSIARFGAISALAILCALAATLLVLPALLHAREHGI